MPLDRKQSRRVFEESLRKAMEQYVPREDVLVQASALDEHGDRVVVAHYKLYVDGHVECFEVLDEVLWPECEEP